MSHESSGSTQEIQGLPAKPLSVSKGVGWAVELETRVQGDTLYVRVRGDLDLMTAGTFREEVEAELERTGVSRLVLNLAGLKFIDSSGLGAILGRFRRLQHRGGRLVLEDPPPAIRPVLEMAGFYRLMEVRESGPGRTAG